MKLGITITTGYENIPKISVNIPFKLEHEGHKCPSCAIGKGTKTVAKPW